MSPAIQSTTHGVGFVDSLKRVAFTLEARTDEELAAACRSHPDPVLREHALYQLMTRGGEAALSVVEAALFDDPNADLRVNLMWALESVRSERCRDLCQDLTDDRDPDIREWARLFCWEMGWTPRDFRTARDASYDEGRIFDQTLPLRRQGDLYVRLGRDGDLWGHLPLSPQVMDRVYGHELACIVTETRDRELVIASLLQGLHEDGSAHHEACLLRGVTTMSMPSRASFCVEATVPRPFYKSGCVDDVTEGVVHDVPITVAREGEWFTNAWLPLKGDQAIEYIRGVFSACVSVNLDRLMSREGKLLFPGSCTLASPHHSDVRPYANGVLIGRFKGKVLDLNQDGTLDLNAMAAHATAAGEIDSNLDGIADTPERTICMRPFARDLEASLTQRGRDLPLTG